VHFLGTCKKRTAAQYLIPFFPAGAKRFFRKSPLCSGSLLASTKKVHRPRSQPPLLFDIGNMWQIRSEKYFSSARRLLSPALLERWPQVCRVKITFTVLLTNSFVSTTKKSTKCVVNWIPPRMRVRSRNTQPCLNLSVGIEEILNFVCSDSKSTWFYHTTISFTTQPFAYCLLYNLSFLPFAFQFQRKEQKLWLLCDVMKARPLSDDSCM